MRLQGGMITPLEASDWQFQIYLLHGRLRWPLSAIKMAEPCRVLWTFFHPAIIVCSIQSRISICKISIFTGCIWLNNSVENSSVNLILLCRKGLHKNYRGLATDIVYYHLKVDAIRWKLNVEILGRKVVLDSTYEGNMTASSKKWWLRSERC